MIEGVKCFSKMHEDKAERIDVSGKSCYHFYNDSRENGRITDVRLFNTEKI